MLIRDNARGVYEIPKRDGEAGINKNDKPQIKNFVGFESSNPVLYDNQNSREINTDKSEVCAAQFDFPKKIDGSFLSLGIGGKVDAKSEFDLSSSETTGQLDGAAFAQLNSSYVQQATGSSMNLGHNLVGGFSSPHNNVVGFTSLGHDMGGCTSSNYNVRISNSGMNSSQFHVVQNPQADMQCAFPTSSTRNLVIVGNRDAIYPNCDPYKGFIDKQEDSYSGPFSNCPAGLPDSGQTGATGLASDSIKLSLNTTQQAPDRLQKRFKERVQNFSPEFSLASSFLGFKGTLAGKEHSGKVISAAKGYGLCQASNLHIAPSLKRIAIQSPPAAPQVHRSKIACQTPIHSLKPYPPRTAPPHIAHIKWQGLDGLPQPSGEKCMLCKRDLSFTPEGPVYQPSVPPAVAVLPCSHTFHDHCLQIITPEDQLNNPPCIPCAIVKSFILGPQFFTGFPSGHNSGWWPDINGDMWSRS